MRWAGPRSGLGRRGGRRCRRCGWRCGPRGEERMQAPAWMGGGLHGGLASARGFAVHYRGWLGPRPGIVRGCSGCGPARLTDEAAGGGLHCLQLEHGSRNALRRAYECVIECAPLLYGFHGCCARSELWRGGDRVV